MRSNFVQSEMSKEVSHLNDPDADLNTAEGNATKANMSADNSRGKMGRALSSSNGNQVQREGLEVTIQINITFKHTKR